MRRRLVVNRIFFCICIANLDRDEVVDVGGKVRAYDNWSYRRYTATKETNEGLEGSRELGLLSLRRKSVAKKSVSLLLRSNNRNTRLRIRRNRSRHHTEEFYRRPYACGTR